MFKHNQLMLVLTLVLVPPFGLSRDYSELDPRHQPIEWLLELERCKAAKCVEKPVKVPFRSQLNSPLRSETCQAAICIDEHPNMELEGQKVIRLSVTDRMCEVAICLPSEKKAPQANYVELILTKGNPFIGCKDTICLDVPNARKIPDWDTNNRRYLIDLIRKKIDKQKEINNTQEHIQNLHDQLIELSQHRANSANSRASNQSNTQSNDDAKEKMGEELLVSHNKLGKLYSDVNFINMKLGDLKITELPASLRLHMEQQQIRALSRPEDTFLQLRMKSFTMAERILMYQHRELNEVRSRYSELNRRMTEMQRQMREFGVQEVALAYYERMEAMITGTVLSARSRWYFNMLGGISELQDQLDYLSGDLSLVEQRFYAAYWQFRNSHLFDSFLVLCSDGSCFAPMEQRVLIKP